MFLSPLQKKTVFCLEGIIETGKVGGDPSALVVGPDSGGISYGIHQSTENAGSLWDLLFKYYPKQPGAYAHFVEALQPYRDKLYSTSDGPGRKFALSKNTDFHNLLIQIAKQDRLMARAQIAMFENDYFQPALDVADEYGLTLPLAALVLYDMSIQSGPAFCKKYVGQFNERWQESDVSDDDLKSGIGYEQLFVRDLINARNNWLETYTAKDAKRQQYIRNSAYRTKALQKLCRDDFYELQLPLTFIMRGKKYTITEGVLKGIDDLQG